MNDALKQRITDLANAMNAGLHEREEHAAVILLAALSGQNIFLLGPPGTAKSLLARRLASVFEGVGPCFEYLMHRFSTPEEIFGPVSIAELKKDNYTRKTEGFLPAAHFAFLDEIWKSSPGILNTLLTIINEKTFRNGTETEKAPLKALIAASNETPPEKQGLEALYDRLVVRLYVPAVKEPGNFDKMIGDRPAESKTRSTQAITDDELKAWREQIHAVELSPETMSIIRDIRRQLDKQSKRLNVYVSDRRWQQAATLLKAAAFFCDRKSTNLADTMLLQHCLWTTDDNREKVMAVVEKAVKDNGLQSEVSSARLSEEKDALEKDIKNDLYYTEDVYKIHKVGGKSCHKVAVHVEQCGYYNSSRERLILYMLSEAQEAFCPLTEKGEELQEFTCTPQKGGSYSVANKRQDRYNLYKTSKVRKPQQSITVVPEISNSKGDRKEVSPNMRKHFRDDVNKISAHFGKAISEIEGKRASLAKEINTPFVPEEKRGVALGGIEEQLNALRSEQADCARLLALIDGE